jgi:aminoglycoside 6-adenylyltransferase
VAGQGFVTGVSPRTDPVLERIRGWARTREDVHAVLLSGSRAAKAAPVDALSDHDVILYSPRPRGLLGGRGWPSEMGPVLLEMPPEGMDDGAWITPTRLVLYRDGTKIDFTVLPVRELEAMARGRYLVPELEAGYRVVYDPEGIAGPLPAPSGEAYHLRPPGQAAFSAVVEEFLWEATYVARNLRRRDLLPLRNGLECVMRTDLLVRMLQWEVGCRQGWDRRARRLGRGLRKELPEPTWRRLEATFPGPGWEDHHFALRELLALFRETGTAVAEALGLSYPGELHDDVLAHLEGLPHPGPPGRGSPR